MQWPGRGVRPRLTSEDIDMARTTKQNDGNRVFINLQGFEPDDDRPEIIVTAQDQKRRQIYSAKVEKDGKVEVPSDVLKKAERFSVGPKDPEGGKALVFRAEQFAAVLERAVLDVSLNIWQNWRFHLHCVTGRVRVCHRSPWWLCRSCKSCQPACPCEQSQTFAIDQHPGAATEL
jgi:hypothetical protein